MTGLRQITNTSFCCAEIGTESFLQCYGRSLLPYTYSVLVLPAIGVFLSPQIKTYFNTNLPVLHLSVSTLLSIELWEGVRNTHISSSVWTSERNKEELFLCQIHSGCSLNPIHNTITITSPISPSFPFQPCTACRMLLLC
jgi:hypothetical protein